MIFMALIAFWKLGLAIYVAYILFDFLKLAITVSNENKKNRDAGYENGTYGYIHSLIENDLEELYAEEIQQGGLDLGISRVPSNDLRKVLPERKVVDIVTHSSYPLVPSQNSFNEYVLNKTFLEISNTAIFK